MFTIVDNVKAYKYEEAGDIELALACMRKSVALVMRRDYYAPDDCYPLVRMLARTGLVDEARQQKAIFDRKFGPPDQDGMVEYEYQKYLDSVTVKWLQENFPSKAPKSVTSYRRMKTQNTKNFQVLKQMAAERGRDISKDPKASTRCNCCKRIPDGGNYLLENGVCKECRDKEREKEELEQEQHIVADLLTNATERSRAQRITNITELEEEYTNTP